MDNDTTADEQAYSSSGEDVRRDHIPTASALKSTYTPPPENSLLAQIGDMATFIDCSSPVPNGRMPQTSHRSSGRCNPQLYLGSVHISGYFHINHTRKLLIATHRSAAPHTINGGNEEIGGIEEKR
ncbi:hypothetical protein Tco_1117748, partial [Tanacetum coccineum]